MTRLALIAALSAAPLLGACAGAQTAGQRADDRTTTARVAARLAADPEVRKFDVDVDTIDGVVTLRGKVSNAAAKQEAEKLARNTEGVRDVRNRLEVEARTFGERSDETASDAWIRAQIGTKLLVDPEVRRWKIDIDVVDGVVTLSGTVSEPAQKQEAEDLSRRTEGVRDVVNELRVAQDDD